MTKGSFCAKLFFYALIHELFYMRCGALLHVINPFLNRLKLSQEHQILKKGSINAQNIRQKF